MAKLSVDQALLKAKSHAKKGEIEEAEKLYKDVLRAFPKNKRAQQGLVALNKTKPPGATELPPQETINQLINLYNQGQLAAVVGQAKDLIKQYPETFIIWNILGAAQQGLGKNADASMAFKRVTELNPNYEDGYSNLGLSLKEQGKLEEAIEAFKKALLIKPDFAEAYNNMGYTLNEQSKLEEAIEAFKKALSIKPDYAAAYNNMGNNLTKQGKFEDAIEAFKKALLIMPDYAEVHNNMGYTLKEQGKLKEALVAFKKALAIKPDYAAAYNNMGNALRDQGKLNEAIANYEKALSIKSDYALAYNNMGIALQDQGKMEEAVEAYNKALSVKPDFDEAFLNLSSTAKNISDAKSWIESCLRANPYHLEAKLLLIALQFYEGDKSGFNTLAKTYLKDHPFTRSFAWLFSLTELPELYFNRWALFDRIIDLSKQDRPFYEFGVWRGEAFQHLINAFKKGYGFDTFDGLPEDWHDTKAGTYSSNGKIPEIEGGEFIVGKFENSLPEFFSEPRPMASVINFDADLYSSTICALNHSRSVIDKHTILIFDEFIMNKNWEQDEFKALNEFCLKNNFTFEVLAISFFTKQAAVRLLSGDQPTHPEVQQSVSQQTINDLVNLYAKGQLTLVVEQAQFLTDKYPEEFIVWNILGGANKGLNRVNSAAEAFRRVTELNPTYPDGFNNFGVALQDQGKLEEAIASYKKALALKPDHVEACNNMGNALKDQSKLDEAMAYYQKALSLKPDYAEAYYNLGAALQDQGKLDEAIASYEKALSLKPDHADAYNNMGNALKNQGKLDEAMVCYQKALSIKPDHADAYNNMGNALQEQGKLDEAIEAYRKALSFKPDYADAYNNMGITLKHQGKLDEAIASYDKALSLKPEYVEAYLNATEVLKLQPNLGLQQHWLVRVENKVRTCGKKILSNSSDKEIALNLLEALDYMHEADFKFETPLSQIYKRNSIDLNCTRHIKIFNQKDIIPEFCFGCFKVQVEVNDLFSLIRLTKIFYDLNTKEDLTRKTMIEMRPDISGFYKGLFYCRGLEQAHNLKQTLDIELHRKFGEDFVSHIKRGCSEYPFKFPDYGEFINQKTVLMDYPPEWKEKEREFDKDSPIKPKGNLIPSASEFCLSDFYIIQKWIDYAKGLDDPACKWLEDKPIVFKDVYNIAVDRKTKFGRFI